MACAHSPREIAAERLRPALHAFDQSSQQPIAAARARDVFAVLVDADTAFVATHAARAPPRPDAFFAMRTSALAAAALTTSELDALMRVLYACMQCCHSSADATTAAAAEDGRFATVPPLTATQTRALYEWHAVVHDAAGDGAIVRALMQQ